MQTNNTSTVGMHIYIYIYTHAYVYIYTNVCAHIRSTASELKDSVKTCEK